MITTAVLDTLITALIMSSSIKLVCSTMPSVTANIISSVIAAMVLFIRIWAFRKMKPVIFFRIIYSIIWTLAIFLWLATHPIGALLLPIFVLPLMILTAVLFYFIRERLRDIFDMLLYRICSKRAERRG